MDIEKVTTSSKREKGPARTRKSRRGESAVFSLSSSFAFGSSIKISLTFYEPKDSELTLLTPFAIQPFAGMANILNTTTD